MRSMSPSWKVALTGLLLLACAGCLGRNAATPVSEQHAPSFNDVAHEEEITPLDTPTDLPSTPTETQLPEIELPTPEATVLLLERWVGAPTYAAESQPGYFFRVDYSPALWALVQAETGLPALVHRDIPYCQMTPTAGRGVPRGVTVEDLFRDFGIIRFEVVTVSQNGVPQYVNYFGGDGTILTGFQVSFQEQGTACLQAAEAVLVTLSSVPEPTPTPSPTDTFTPSPSETPTITPIPSETPTATP